jgi:hypothetical protein
LVAETGVVSGSVTTVLTGRTEPVKRWKEKKKGGKFDNAKKANPYHFSVGRA